MNLLSLLIISATLVSLFYSQKISANNKSKELKTKFSFSRYKKTLDRSPFDLNINVSNTITNVNINSDLVLVGISEINNTPTVILFNKKNREYISINENSNQIKNDKQNIKILKIIKKNGDPRETKVKISHNDQNYTISYDQNHISFNKQNNYNTKNKFPISKRNFKNSQNRTSYNVSKSKYFSNKTRNSKQNKFKNLKNKLPQKSKTTTKRRQRIIPKKWNNKALLKN